MGTQSDNHSVEFTEGQPQRACIVLESLGTDHEAAPVIVGSAAFGKADLCADLLELSLEQAEKKSGLCSVGAAVRDRDRIHPVGAKWCDGHDSSRAMSRTVSRVPTGERSAIPFAPVRSSRVTVGRG